MKRVPNLMVLVLASAMPAILFWIGDALVRAGLWRQSPDFGPALVLQMLLYEGYIVPFYGLLGIAPLLLVQRRLRGRPWLRAGAALVFLFLNSQLVETSLQFSVCEGGPHPDDCTDPQVADIHMASLMIALVWAALSVATEWSLRRRGTP